MRKLRKTLGFTVVELLVALCMAGAVGAVAAPSYVGAMKTAKGGEAKANLNTFFLGQKIYRANNGKYWNASGASVNTINNTLGVNISSKEFPGFGYSGGDTSYQASFSGQGRNYSINDGGALTEGMLFVAAKPVTVLNPTPTLNPVVTLSPSPTATVKPVSVLSPTKTLVTSPTTIASDSTKKTTTTSPTPVAAPAPKPVAVAAPAPKPVAVAAPAPAPTPVAAPAPTTTTTSTSTITSPSTTTSSASTTTSKSTRKKINLEM